MNVEAAKKNLLEVKKILDSLKVKFWFRGGTLLGAVRDKSFIPWDNDIDLMMLAKDWEPSMLEIFKAKGFPRCNEWRWYPNKVSAVRLKRRGIEVNVRLEYYYAPDDVYVCLAKSPNDHTTIIPVKFLRNDFFLEFLGQQFRVPNPPKKFILSHYGKNWRTPDKEWHKSGRKNWKWGISLEKYLQWFDENPKEKWLR